VEKKLVADVRDRIVHNPTPEKRIEQRTVRAGGE